MERELKLSLKSDLQNDRMLDLLGGLLTNQPGLAGLQYWANGSGDPSWDATPPVPSKADTKLAKEVYRKPISPAADITYQPLTQTLVVRSRLAFNESASVLREFGLFGGNATGTADSGYMLNHQIHKAIDKTKAENLLREFRLLLGPSNLTKTPDLSNMLQADAATALKAAKLAVGDVAQEENDAAAGKVVRQNPVPGTDVLEEMGIDIVVAVKSRRTVPSLRGLTVAEATTVLTGLNLVLDPNPPARKESRCKPDTVIEQVPAAGTRVDQGTVVTIVLAQPVTTLVPDLTGLTVPAASLVAARAKLALSSPPYATVDTLQDFNTVASQTPAPDTRVPEGTAVVPTIKVGPSVSVPALLGLMPEQAAVVLRDSAAPVLQALGLPSQPPGLAVGAQSAAENPAAPGSILNQDPAPAAKAPIYSAVSITMAVPISAVVPSLTGKSQADAAAALQAVNLKLGKVTMQPAVSAVNSVVDQDPAAGAHIPIGSTVDISIATPIQTEVPAMIGKGLDYAKEVLASSSLLLGDATTKPSSLPAGTILEQNPAAGSKVFVGTRVSISISGVTVAVPNLAGMTVDQARQALTTVKLVLGTVTSIESERPAGQIVNQSPFPQENVLTGSVVNVVVAVIRHVTVPGVVGMTATQAASLLAGLQLRLATIGQTESDAAPGTVLTQEPIQGQSVEVGTTVRVTVAIPRTVSVPQVTRMTEANARAALAAAKLQMVVSGQVVSDVPAGAVASQTPAPGTRVNQGSTVTVAISRGSRVTVPRFVGMSIDDAQSIAAANRLSLSVTTRVGEEGIVLQQSPLPKVQVDPGSVVHVVVGRGQERISHGGLTRPFIIR